MTNKESRSRIRSRRRLLTFIGILAMILLEAVNALSPLHLEGCALVVDFDFFFIIEATSVTPRVKSGLLFCRQCENYDDEALTTTKGAWRTEISIMKQVLFLHSNEADRSSLSTITIYVNLLSKTAVNSIK